MYEPWGAILMVKKFIDSLQMNGDATQQSEVDRRCQDIKKLARTQLQISERELRQLFPDVLNQTSTSYRRSD